MRNADVPVLVDVLARAYASARSYESRLRATIGMRSAATFVAELEGVPVGMVVGYDYGPLAYVAQMAVDPAMQRRGIATQLMHDLTAWLDARGFAATELDATPAGEPLYRRYGFGEAGATVVYRGASAAAAGASLWPARRYTAADAAPLLAADAAAFGGDRSVMLRMLVGDPQNAVIVLDRDGAPAGYAIAQPVAGRLGPLVALHPADAGGLLDAARRLLPGEHEIAVPAENGVMRTLLLERGYTPLRSLTHMRRGRALPARRERLYARTNLGQG